MHIAKKHINIRLSRVHAAPSWCTSNNVFLSVSQISQDRMRWSWEPTRHTWAHWPSGKQERIYLRELHGSRWISPVSTPFLHDGRGRRLSGHGDVSGSFGTGNTKHNSHWRSSHVKATEIMIWSRHPDGLLDIPNNQSNACVAKTPILLLEAQLSPNIP